MKDDPRLKLAEVYYWEGKHRDGRALLDQVLKARNRDPQLLLDVSRLLRQVGSLYEARALAEEAYQTGRTLSFKQHTAVVRSLIGIDLDDMILWLRRGDLSNPEVKALLNWDLADQAIDHGDEPRAVAHLREAIALYDSMFDEAATLSNAAMLLFRLSTLTGERWAFASGFRKIEAAHEREPTNTITMTNVALFVQEASLREIIGPAIDFRLLKENAELDCLAFLYHDQTGRKDFARRLGWHAGINRLIALNERALLLSPRRGNLYETLNELYAYRGETEKQRGLLRRLEPIDLDLAGEIVQARENYAGGRQVQERTEATGAILRAAATFKAVLARKPKHDPTFALAANHLARTLMSGSYAGIAADPNTIVALAEEAHAASPSYGTRELVISTLLFRAGRRMAHTQPVYARMAEQTRFSTTDVDLIAVALNGPNPLRDAARQDPDIRRAADLMRQIYRDDPEYEASPWTWSVIHALDPDEAAKIAQTSVQNEPAQITRAIQQRVEPVSASVALSVYWAAEMVGKNADGPSILGAYAARGVPLPIVSP